MEKEEVSVRYFVRFDIVSKRSGLTARNALNVFKLGAITETSVHTVITRSRMFQPDRKYAPFGW